MSEKQIPLTDLEGLVIDSVESTQGEVSIMLRDGTNISIVHECCGCCDPGGYEITATRNE